MGGCITSNELAAQNLDPGTTVSTCHQAAGEVGAGFVDGSTVEQPTTGHPEGGVFTQMDQTAAFGAFVVRVGHNGTAVQLEGGVIGLVGGNHNHTAIGTGGFGGEYTAAYGIDHCQIAVDQKQTGIPCRCQGVSPQVQHDPVTGNDLLLLVLNIIPS